MLTPYERRSWMLAGCGAKARSRASPHLAVDDIEVLIREVLEHFVDVILPVQLAQGFQQVTPAKRRSRL